MKDLGKQTHSLTVLKEAVDLDLSIFDIGSNPMHFYVLKLFLLSYPINHFEPYPNNVEENHSESSSPLIEKPKLVPRKLKNHNSTSIITMNCNNEYNYDNFSELLDVDILDSFEMSPNVLHDRGSISLLQETYDDVMSPVKKMSPYKMINSSTNDKKRKSPPNDLATSKHLQHSPYSGKDKNKMSMSSAEHLLMINSSNTNKNKFDINVMNKFQFQQESPLKFSSTDSFNKQQYVSYLIIIYIFWLNCRK